MASSQHEVRTVLIGKTGNGKSSTGNSLLHSRSAFYSTQSPKSITKGCEAKTCNCTDAYGHQTKLTVVDTPGFYDTDGSRTNDMVQDIIASQMFKMTSPGVHAFLIIVRVDRFTPEEKNTVNFIKTIFGEDAAKYCIVIFTREDQLEEGQTIDDFINNSDELKELVQRCGNRKFAINNKLDGERLKRKTDQLLQMVDQMVQSNGGNYYTNAQYQKIEKQRIKEQARKEKEERKEREKHEESLIEKGREKERRKAGKREQELARQEEEREKARKREEEQQERHSTKEDICRCPCHTNSGVIHVVPCCFRSRFDSLSSSAIKSAVTTVNRVFNPR